MAELQSYKALIETVESYLHRSDIEDDIRVMIWLAECAIQRTLDMRINDTQIDGVTIAGQDYIDLPRDYVEGKFLNWTSDSQLPNLEITSLDMTTYTQKNPQLVPSTGNRVRVATVHGNRLIIGQSPGEKAYTLYYRSGVSHLSEDAPSNILLREYPDTLVFGALTVSAPFVGADERMPVWQSFYADGLEETRQAVWRARASSGTLRMRPEVTILV